MSAPDPNTIKSLIVTNADLSGMSLATRIFIGRLRIEIGRLRIEVANNPACLSDKIAELSGFVGKNAFAATDLALI